ncbi:hypothetical protein EV199_2462 [Pseudobacter ginsenosidimutans]|uniref:Uncharacterized protein n=2 Tax=Pseudobacter ginsenosidimutans TaxID=661488 RepID=A0A4Q7N667_9BACT|nr:hypothetical protein EV199_2462 [Pseudobacter ginsenosidimutans]
MRAIFAAEPTTSPMISVGGTAIKNFKKDFTVDGETITIDFITMNCVEKQLYQLYIPYNDGTVRVHVQRNENGDFKIMGDNVCPAKFLPLEAAFDEAIKNY